MEPGTKIGSYQIVSPLGAGGMGEVFRAHDPKLDREVAIKVLPKEMNTDPERIARFHREARALATFQHPNIASVYGFEEDGGTHFLVMELVEGQDLSERLSADRLTIDEAVALAVQIAEGLAAAHEQGIVHRDLKPANIKIGPEGDIKILDFGLARAYAGDSVAGDDILSSPTITAAMTQAGVILGTAAYMSPEQARGEAVDQRADLWAFGVILFEMITGNRFFAGNTVSDTLAAVLRDEIDWDLLPAETPANVRRVLRRCLERKLKDRQRSAGDARLELLHEEQPATAVTLERKRSFALPLALAALALAILGAAWIFKPGAHTAESRPPTHLSLALPDGLQIASRDVLPLGAPQPCLGISDDGRLIVATVERDGDTWLYRRFLDEPEGELLEETRGAYHPLVSPDGESISFMQDNGLMRMAARGEHATRLAELPNAFGHTWISNHEIIVNSSEATKLLLVDTERGDATELIDGKGAELFYWPGRVLGRRAVLFNSISHAAKSSETDLDQVSILDLETMQSSILGLGGSMPRFLQGGPLLLVRDGMVMSAPLDLENPTAEIRPKAAIEGVVVEGWIGQYAISENGTVVYVPGEWMLGNELVWDDGNGSVEPLGFPLLGYGDFEISPDGTQLAISAGGGADSQIWIYDLGRGTRRLLTTDEPGALLTWGPDSRQVAYTSTSGPPWKVFVRTVGSNEPSTVVYEGDRQVNPYAWHEDVGIACSAERNVVRIDPVEPESIEVIISSSASEWGPDLSPDGRWIAYTSDESGQYEVYARALSVDRSYTISHDGGEEPIFSADGKSIYYRNGNRFYRTPILEASSDGTRFRAGRPEVVVEGAYSNVPGLSYDVGPDERLLLLRSAGGTERPDHLNVILDWRPESVD